MDKGNIISALCWVDRGYAAAQLTEYQPSEAEMLKHKKISKKLMKGGDIQNTDIGDAVQQIEKNMNEMDLDDKSEDFEDMSGEEVEDIDDDELGGNLPVFSDELYKLKEKAMKVKSQVLREKNSDDEMAEDEGDRDFVDDNLPDEFSDSEEDVEDFTIRRSDSIIVTATAVDDHSNLEVYIYDHKTSDLYVHHEIILGAYPLCMEWLNTW